MDAEYYRGSSNLSDDYDDNINMKHYLVLSNKKSSLFKMKLYLIILILIFLHKKNY